MTSTNTIDSLESADRRWRSLLVKNFDMHSDKPTVLHDVSTVLLKSSLLTNDNKAIDLSPELMQNFEVLGEQADKLLTSYWAAYQKNPKLSRALQAAFEEQAAELVRALDLLEDRVTKDIIAALAVNTEFLKEKYNSGNR